MQNIRKTHNKVHVRGRRALRRPGDVGPRETRDRGAGRSGETMSSGLVRFVATLLPAALPVAPPAAAPLRAPPETPPAALPAARPAAPPSVAPPSASPSSAPGHAQARTRVRMGARRIRCGGRVEGQGMPVNMGTVSHPAVCAGAPALLARRSALHLRRALGRGPALDARLSHSA